MIITLYYPAGTGIIEVPDDATRLEVETVVTRSGAVAYAVGEESQANLPSGKET